MPKHEPLDTDLRPRIFLEEAPITVPQPQELLDFQFPWLKHLEPEAAKIVVTLFEKEKNYRGSWQKRGGIGAFMMMARKWDRIENIAAASHFDVLKVMGTNEGDVIDDIRDLVGYLLLCLAKHKEDKEPDL